MSHLTAAAECPPPRCDPHALTDAAVLARALYPGPVGEVLARDLKSTAVLGFLGPDGVSARLAEWLTDEAHRRVAAGDTRFAVSDRPQATNTPAPVSPEPPKPQGRTWGLLRGAR